jgi:hypothetical protein
MVYLIPWDGQSSEGTSILDVFFVESYSYNEQCIDAEPSGKCQSYAERERDLKLKLMGWGCEQVWKNHAADRQRKAEYSQARTENGSAKCDPTILIARDPALTGAGQSVGYTFAQSFYYELEYFAKQKFKKIFHLLAIRTVKVSATPTSPSLLGRCV